MSENNHKTDNKHQPPESEPGYEGEKAGHLDDKKSKSAIKAGVFAYFVDMYDIYLPVMVLLPANAYFRSENLSSSVIATLNAFIFTSTLIGRPLGAAIFGNYADKYGRKKLTLIAVAGFGICTLLIALLPGYETIGIYSMVLLILLRFVDGIFLGGEYTSAIPLAMEWSPKEKRGFYSGLITSMSPAGYAVTAVFTLVLLHYMPSGDINSAYVQYGWRIPFVVGAILAAILYYVYATSVEEPDNKPDVDDDPVVTSRSPLTELVVGAHRKSLLQVFILMTGAWLAVNMTAVVLPGLLVSQLGVKSIHIAIIMSVAMFLCALSYLVLGALSQRIGRRRFFIINGLAVAVIGSLAYLFLFQWGGGFLFALVMSSIIVLLAISTFAPIAAYLTERFPRNIRASGYGVGYSLSLIIPSFYAFYLEMIGSLVPVTVAPVILLGLGGLLVSLGGAMGPETKDVDM